MRGMFLRDPCSLSFSDWEWFGIEAALYGRLKVREGGVGSIVARLEG